MSRTPLLVITGPTASGKSELALQLALRLGGEIISADSAQVYRGLDIGTAKPTARERRLVPHHLLDIIDPTQRFDVASFQAMTDRLAAEISQRGRLPILAGGTGLYIRAVIERFVFQPLAHDPELRRRLYGKGAQDGSHALHRELQRVDPDSARRIHPNDLRRIVRALEVYYLTGTPLSRAQYHDPTSNPYDALVIRLSVPRPLLYRRIERRTNGQIAAGWIAEVRALLRRFPPSAPGLQILGYRELVSYLQGAGSLDDTIAEIKKNTKHYARRQLTWLKKERSDEIVDVTGGITHSITDALAKIIFQKWQETLFSRRSVGTVRN